MSDIKRGRKIASIKCGENSFKVFSEVQVRKMSIGINKKIR